MIKEAFDSVADVEKRWAEMESVGEVVSTNCEKASSQIKCSIQWELALRERSEDPQAQLIFPKK